MSAAQAPSEFPPPPQAERFSELVRMRVKEVKDSGGTRESITVDRNGQPLHVEVIEVPLADLLYNPATHRIRAQLGHDQEREQELKIAPWEADKGQKYLELLLCADPGRPDQRDPAFEALKEDLANYGQNDPGLITHSGILVNGNTRAAALRELGVQTMRVGVLPKSFTWADINAVELALQLRKDHRRGYSFINQLLALEEQAGLGRTPEAIAKDFRIKVKTYERERWILQELRDQIERSRDGSASLRLVDFENAAERLKELHRDYVQTQSADPDQAEVLKEYRIAAIILGFAKTDVRYIKENFRDTYLTDGIPPTVETAPSQSEQTGMAVPGLDVSLPGPAPEVVAARELSRQVLQARAYGTSSAVSEEERQNATQFKEGVKNAFDKALTRAGRDTRLQMRKQMAPERLKEARDLVDACTSEIVKAKGSRSFDVNTFDQTVLDFRDSLRRLALQVDGVESIGEGISWLLAAANVEGA